MFGSFQHRVSTIRFCHGLFRVGVSLPFFLICKLLSPPGTTLGNGCPNKHADCDDRYATHHPKHRPECLCLPGCKRCPFGVSNRLCFTRYGKILSEFELTFCCFCFRHRPASGFLLDAALFLLAALKKSFCCDVRIGSNSFAPPERRRNRLVVPPFVCVLQSESIQQFTVADAILAGTMDQALIV